MFQHCVRQSPRTHEIISSFERDQLPATGKRLQYGDRKRATSRTCFDDLLSTSNISVSDDEGGILGIDDGCTTGHSKGKVRIERSERLILHSGIGFNNGTLRLANEVIMQDPPFVGVEGGARLQRE